MGGRRAQCVVLGSLRSADASVQCNFDRKADCSVCPRFRTDDFERYWQVAAKLVPLPAPFTTGASLTTTASTRSSTPSQALGEGKGPDANGAKHVPIRVYLPEGGGVVQEMVAPLRRDGPFPWRLSSARLSRRLIQ